MMSETDIAQQLKPLLLKDLRIQCRARGINPGGNREALQERVKEHMMATGDTSLAAEFNGEVALGVPQPKAAAANDGAIGVNNNNYSREQGQNVGNFITDRPSSRVLAPPGGAMSWNMSGEMPGDTIKARPTTQRTAAPWEAEEATVAAPVHSKEALIGGGEEGGHNNNYSRPQGQNVGNFMTDKPSSRVLAPPGGGSSIVFG